MAVTTHALDIGAMTPFWMFEEREKMFEFMSGCLEPVCMLLISDQEECTRTYLLGLWMTFMNFQELLSSD